MIAAAFGILALSAALALSPPAQAQQLGSPSWNQLTPKEREVLASLRVECEFGRCRSLTCSVNADDGDDGELTGFVLEDGGYRGKTLLYFLFRDVKHIQPVLTLCFVSLSDRSQDLTSHRHAQVRSVQGEL